MVLAVGLQRFENRVEYGDGTATRPQKETQNVLVELEIFVERAPSPLQMPCAVR